MQTQHQPHENTTDRERERGGRERRRERGEITSVGKSGPRAYNGRIVELHDQQTTHDRSSSNLPIYQSIISQFSIYIGSHD